MDKCEGCPFLVDTVGGLDPKTDSSYFECNQVKADCHLTDTGKRIIEAMLAGEGELISFDYPENDPHCEVLGTKFEYHLFVPRDKPCSECKGTV